MADIELVIKIDAEDLERIKARTGKSSSDYIILNGKPLPKGHGRLIDADALKHTLNFYMRQWDGEYDYAEGRYDSYEVAIDELNDADTIIGADKEGENKGVLEQLAKKQNNLLAVNKAWSDAIEKNGYMN